MYFFITDRVFRCRIVLEDYGPDTEYIKDDKNIVAENLSCFYINRNKETAQESTYNN